MWRIARSVYRVKFIGQIETSVKSYHVDEASKEKFVSFTVYDKEHYYTINLSEQSIRDAVEHFDKKKENETL